MGMYTGQTIGAQKWGRKIAWWMAVALMNVWVPVLMILETVIGIAVSPLLLVLWLAVTRWPLGKIMRHFVWIYGRVWLWIISPFVRLKVRVTESERLRGPGIYVVNHLSFFDIFFTSALPVFDVILCLRSWPFKLAWYAPFMRWAEYVDVEQLSWDEIVQRVQQIFEKGRSILLFPQGHRSRDGRLTRYYSGAFKLAIQFNVPVIAVCISGTDQMLPPGRHWMAPADVRLECLAPIEPTTFRKELGHIEFRKHVKELMGACLAKGQF